jgi:hypothetical protein
VAPVRERLRLTEQTVRALVAPHEPTASVYFGHVERDLGGEELDWETRRRAVTGTLLDQGAGESIVEAMTPALADVELTPAMLAAFTTTSGPLREFRLPGLDQPDTARFAAPAMVLPLLSWLQDRPPHLVVVIDRTGADLELVAAADRDSRRWTVAGPDDEIERNAPGGWAQARYQHRAEDSWKHNARRVAEEVSAALRHSGARVLVISGDVRAVQLLQEELPIGVRQTVAVRQISGSRSADGSECTRHVQVADAVRRVAEQRTAELLDQFAEARAPRGLAVEGPRATAAALARGAVATLFVAPGVTGDLSAWFGPAPTDILFGERRTPVGWEAARRGRFADVAVRTALLTDAAVRVLPPDLAGAPGDGVGALCRFR